MTAAKNRQILLAEVPKGKLAPEHFRLTEAPVPTPKDGEVLLRVRLISLDAANRAWMQGATYREAVTAGSVMAGGAIARSSRARRRALPRATSYSPTRAGRTTPCCRPSASSRCRKSSR